MAYLVAIIIVVLACGTSINAVRDIAQGNNESKMMHGGFRYGQHESPPASQRLAYACAALLAAYGMYRLGRWQEES